jgi:hypothetical protein
VRHVSVPLPCRFLACIDKRQGITILEVETGALEFLQDHRESIGPATNWSACNIWVLLTYAGRVVHRIPTGGFVPPTLEWNPKHLVLAWPAAPPVDYRGETMRDSEGGISVCAPL